MLILVTTLGIFTFTDKETALCFETDFFDYGYLNGRHTEKFWPFFTILNFGEGAQLC